jgi:hypothetical protein
MACLALRSASRQVEADQTPWSWSRVRGGVASDGEQEVDGLAEAVDGAIQVGPDALDLDVRLVDPPGTGDLLGQQGVDRLEGAELATLDLLDDGLQRLQRPGHAQADQVVADPRDRVIWRGDDAHAAAPWGNRLPTIS